MNIANDVGLSIAPHILTGASLIPHIASEPSTAQQTPIPGTPTEDRDSENAPHSFGSAPRRRDEPVEADTNAKARTQAANTQPRRLPQLPQMSTPEPAPPTPPAAPSPRRSRAQDSDSDAEPSDSSVRTDSPPSDDSDAPHLTPALRRSASSVVTGQNANANLRITKHLRFTSLSSAGKTVSLEQEEEGVFYPGGQHITRNASVFLTEPGTPNISET
jgi:hypothetical protein